MRATLISRLERLEATTANRRTVVYRYGYLKALPKDFVGERHVVIVTQESAGSPYCEWCHFEERPDLLRWVLLIVPSESISPRTTRLPKLNPRRSSSLRP